MVMVTVKNGIALSAIVVRYGEYHLQYKFVLLMLVNHFALLLPLLMVLALHFFFYYTSVLFFVVATVTNNPKKHFIHANYPKELLFSRSFISIVVVKMLNRRQTRCLAR